MRRSRFSSGTRRQRMRTGRGTSAEKPTLRRTSADGLNQCVRRRSRISRGPQQSNGVITHGGLAPFGSSFRDCNPRRHVKDRWCPPQCPDPICVAKNGCCSICRLSGKVDCARWLRECRGDLFPPPHHGAARPVQMTGPPRTRFATVVYERHRGSRLAHNDGSI